MRCRSSVLVTAVAIVAAGCGNGNLDSADEFCGNVDYALTWQAVGRPLFRTYCTACHSAETPERFGAPEGVDFDTKEQVIEWYDRIYSRVLDEGTMPLGGGVPDDDLLLLRDYLVCGL